MLVRLEISRKNPTSKQVWLALNCGGSRAGAGDLDPRLIFRPNWGPKGQKKILKPPPYLRVWMTEPFPHPPPPPPPPPPSPGLKDPTFPPPPPPPSPYVKIWISHWRKSIPFELKLRWDEQRKRATFAVLLLKEINSNVAGFTTHK